MQPSLITTGTTTAQFLEDLRGVIRRELQTHAPTPPATPAEAERKPQTARQLATTYNICVATVWEWCRQGKFASHKIGGRTYFYADEVAAALETKQRTVKAGKGGPRRG